MPWVTHRKRQELKSFHSSTSVKPATDSSKQRSHDELAEQISWNNKELREAQLADEELRLLIQWKEADGKCPDW